MRLRAFQLTPVCLPTELLLLLLLLCSFSACLRHHSCLCSLHYYTHLPHTCQPPCLPLTLFPLLLPACLPVSDITSTSAISLSLSLRHCFYSGTALTSAVSACLPTSLPTVVGNCYSCSCCYCYTLSCAPNAESRLVITMHSMLIPVIARLRVSSLDSCIYLKCVFLY